MKLILTLLSVVIMLANWSCSTIKSSKYFQLQENRVESYAGMFSITNDVKDFASANSINIPVPPRASMDRDTLFDTTQVTYKTINIDGHKAYYSLDVHDTLEKNPNIGPMYFLFSAVIFEHDSVYVAPAYEKADLEKLHFSDFKYVIPPTVKQKDSIYIRDGKKVMILCNFLKSSLELNGRTFKECLHFDLLEVWPETLYKGEVWLHKKYGLLKWIRSTGRVETRIL